MLRAARQMAALSLIAAVTPALAATASAQPSVRVRSETRIELRTLRRPGHVVVEGALRDDLGEPLVDRRIILRATPDDPTLPGSRHPLTTDAQGGFSARMDLETGGHRLSATFVGDDTHDRVEVERRLDLDRADVRLRVVVPDGGRLDLDRPSHVVEVVAESTEGGAGLGIDLVDELERPLARGRTDGAGRVRFEIPAGALGASGAGRIKARSRADALRAEAQTEVPVVRYRATELTLAASRDEARPGERVVFSGELRDSTGPLEGRAVGLFADGEHLTTVLTMRDGSFEAPVEPDARHAGRLEVVARYQSDAPGRASSESRVAVVEVAGARTTPWPWLLLPLIASGVLLLWIARRAPKRPEKQVETPEERPVGVATARRQSLRADRRDVSGQVVDHRDDRPASGARLTLRGPAGRRLEGAVDEAGRFLFADLEPGAWTLTVEAEGYVGTESRLSVPHRGEWSQVTVRLESMRSRALSPYRPVAAEVLPAPRLWGVWTTGDVLQEARRTGREPSALGDLTGRVERAYYGPEPPDEGEVAVIDARADETLRELRPESTEAPPRTR